MRSLLKKNSMLLADIMILLIIIATITVVAFFCRARTAIYNSKVYSLNEGWYTADDKTYAINDLPAGDITLTHSLKGINLHRMRLCFESSDTHVTAEFDGEVTYVYAPKQAAVLGRSYGRYVHLIPIPAEAKTVTLKLHSVYAGESPIIRDTAVEDAGVFIAELYKKGLPKFAVCVLIALFGALMVIIGFADKITDDSDINFFSLGAFAIIVGIWSANDTMVLQIYTMHPELISFMRYMCLIFVVYLPVSFMASSTNNRKTKLLPILLAMVLINFTLTLTLSALRISDAHLMLPFSHFNVLIALMMTIFLMIRAIKLKTLDDDFQRTVITAMTFAALGVASDLLRYILCKGKLSDTSYFTRIGVLIFVSLLGVQLIRKRTQLTIKKERAAIMEKLAYSDSLTGLSNRAAFHEKEEEIRQNNTGCIIIQLDINYLKKVNDVYGHAEGDRHIISAAHIIRNSFCKIGTSYRTGGDEFIVIAQDCELSLVESALKELDAEAERYNAENIPPVPLQIAYGYAEYVSSSGMLEASEQLADQRMYEKKREMKALI